MVLRYPGVGAAWRCVAQLPASPTAVVVLLAGTRSQVHFAAKSGSLRFRARTATDGCGEGEPATMSAQT
jgi:hypothetical protein